jgi:hypothetical protein
VRTTAVVAVQKVLIRRPVCQRIRPEAVDKRTFLAVTANLKIEPTPSLRLAETSSCPETGKRENVRVVTPLVLEPVLRRL